MSSASVPVVSSPLLEEALAKLPAKWHPDRDVSRPTLYWFPFSQPSRAVAQLLAEGNIAHKKVSIDINKKMEQKDPLYIQYINPAGLVPALFKPAEGKWMAESNDIMKYLISQNPAQLSSFYPPLSDAAAVEFIDSQLKFISDKVRPVATGLVRAIAGSKDKAKVRQLMGETPALVHDIEQRFGDAASRLSASASGAEGKADVGVVYFAGTSQPTIADLQLLHELVATKDLGFFPWDEKAAPRLTRWYAAMRKRPATKKTYGQIKTIVNVLGAVLKVKKLFGGVTL